MIRWALIAVFIAAMGLAGGCIELREALLGVMHDLTGGPPPSDGVGDRLDDGATLTVTLSVSNNSPRVSEQLSEEVLLRCEVTGGDPEGATLEFRDPVDRLILDRSAGTASFITASFIADESDIGAAFAFTCLATDSSGAVTDSNEQVIIPTS